MGLFSNPKCPIHKTEYSVGTNGLENYYYCKQCKAKRKSETDEKRKIELEMQKLTARVAELERKAS